MDYTTLGKIPIDEQNPVGEDVKYDEDFEFLESELSKLTSPSASNEIDWDMVVKHSSLILQKKSKHILVAVYLSYALYKTQGIDGLDDGVKVLAEMLENYWETLYPPKRRLKGRINAIEWWLDRISKELENIDNIQLKSDKKESLLTNLKKIDTFLSEQLDDSPLFYNLINSLDMKITTDSGKAKEKVVAEEEAPPPPKEVKIVTEPTKILDSNTEDDFKNIINNLGILTGQMIETKDYRAELFILNRASIWLDIDEVPSSDKNITMLPSPDVQEIELLNSLYKDKKYDALLFSAESRIATYIFWLDLHFFVAESLRHLAAEESSHVVYEQTLYFIKKLPNLQNLSFVDSTPFASKLTKKWLKPKEENRVVVESENRKEISKLNSMDDIQDKMSHSASVEEEVFYNIEMCKFLIDKPNDILLYTYTKKLMDIIKKYEITSWNPSIALEAYTVSLECLKLLADNDLNTQLVNISLREIALLKPSLVEKMS